MQSDEDAIRRNVCHEIRHAWQMRRCGRPDRLDSQLFEADADAYARAAGLSLRGYRGETWDALAAAPAVDLPRDAEDASELFLGRTIGNLKAMNATLRSGIEERARREEEEAAAARWMQLQFQRRQNYYCANQAKAEDDEWCRLHEAVSNLRDRYEQQVREELHKRKHRRRAAQP